MKRPQHRQTTFIKKNKVEGLTLLISRFSNKDSIFVSRLTSKIEPKRKALYRERDNHFAVLFFKGAKVTQ